MTTLTYEEVEALPPGSAIRESITETPSGRGNWAEYVKTEDGLWEAVNLDPHTMSVVPELRDMLPLLPLLSTDDLREASESQDAAGKKGTVSLILLSAPSAGGAEEGSCKSA